MDLKELLLKTAGELEPEERDFIKENKDKLSDEDVNAYSSFLEADETPAQEEPPITPPAPEATPEQPAQEEPKVFKTQAEIDAYLEEKTKSNQPPAPVAPTVTPTAYDPSKAPVIRPEVAEKYFPEGYVPANPVEYANRMTAALAEQAQIEQSAVEERNRKFDEEYRGIVTKNNLPDPTTEEGQKVRNQIINIGVKYHSQNYQEAFDLYSSLPPEKGGIFNAAPAKPDMTEQKRVAGMTGSGSSGGGDAPKTSGVSYEDIHSKSMDQLLDSTRT